MIDMIVERPTLRLTLMTLHDHHLPVPAAASVTEGTPTASSNGQVDPSGLQPEPQPLRETAASGSGRR
jgi:hypothetical protein